MFSVRACAQSKKVKNRKKKKKKSFDSESIKWNISKLHENQNKNWKKSLYKMDNYYINLN